MENRLTKALGCGDIPDVATYERITRAILNDAFLYKKVIEDLIWERGPLTIQQMHRLEIKAFQKRVNFVRKNPQIRIIWEWIPEFRTITGQKPQLRACRYFGDNRVPEEKMHWDPTRFNSIEEFSAITEPWTHTRPSADVVIEFGNWLNGVSPEYAAEMRRIKADQAEAAQKKQTALTGELAAAVYTQTASEVRR